MDNCALCVLKASAQVVGFRWVYKRWFR